MNRRTVKHLAPDDPRHGTVNGYNNHKCSCDECRAAWREYIRPYVTAYNRRRGIRPLAEWEAIRPKAEHGTESKYARGCRCDECRDAANEARRRRRHANLEAANKYDRDYKWLTGPERRSA